MALLGIDYGTKKIGLAYAEDLESFAVKLNVIEVRSLEDTLRKIEEILTLKKIDTVIIGNPLDQNGEETTMSHLVDRFIQNLKSTYGKLIVHKVNETLTSKQARESFKGLKISRQVDSEVARMLLQEYLDSAETN